MKIISTLILLFLGLTSYAFEPDVNKIFKEGVLLYKLENASRNGTIDMMSRLPNKADNVNGYISYMIGDSLICAVFFEGDDQEKVLVRYQFDTSINSLSETPLSIDTINTVPSQFESELLSLKENVWERFSNNEDDFFTFYKNVPSVFLPIITPEERKVYIFTVPNKKGIIYIGNDYLLTFNSDNELIKKEKLHDKLFELPYTSETDEEMTATMHTHETSDFIDPTDICILLLYRDFVEWNKHYVIGKKYVSIFDMKNISLSIITREKWDDILEGQVTD